MLVCPSAYVVWCRSYVRTVTLLDLPAALRLGMLLDGSLFSQHAILFAHKGGRTPGNGDLYEILVRIDRKPNKERVEMS